VINLVTTAQEGRLRSSPRPQAAGLHDPMQAGRAVLFCLSVQASGGVCSVRWIYRAPGHMYCMAAIAATGVQ
jgi:hypothetical protein